MRTLSASMAAVALLLNSCSADPSESEPQSASSAPATSSTSTPSASPIDVAPHARADPDAVDTAVAMTAVRYLAREIGPRPGTSRAFHQAANWVATELNQSGWQVHQQFFPVPAGSSVAGPTQGLPVEAGRSLNVIATRGDVVRDEPWLLVGAHLDTVPTSPGAEDNASGVGALLAIADAIAHTRTRLPVVLVAFGAEEPRGPSDEDHHYGSRAYVAALDPAQRRSLRGMVSMDRVGIGGALPVGSAEDGDPLRAELVRAAGRIGTPVTVESGQRSSDHWSFVRDGLPGVRLGSIPYAGYHSPDDVVPGVEPEAVTRAARVAVAWLR